MRLTNNANLINTQDNHAASKMAEMRSKMQSRMARSVDTTISTGQATSNNLTDTAGTSSGAAQNGAVASTGNQQELSMSTVSLGATVSTTIKDGEGVSTQATADASQNADTANATTGVNVNAQQALKAYKDMGDSSAQAKQDIADHQKYLTDLFAKQKTAAELLDKEIMSKMWDGSRGAPLQQAGVSALGQANQAQQQVLSLYRG
jgi:hypothetical protein